jgi:hypothetical protein
MNPDYLKFVCWNEEDGLFVGYCPDLFIGASAMGMMSSKSIATLLAWWPKKSLPQKKSDRPLPEQHAQVMLPAV